MEAVGVARLLHRYYVGAIPFTKDRKIIGYNLRWLLQHSFEDLV